MWEYTTALPRNVLISCPNGSLLLSTSQNERGVEKNAFQGPSGKSFVKSLISFIKYYPTKRLSMKQLIESLIFSLITEISNKHVRM